MDMQRLSKAETEIDGLKADMSDVKARLTNHGKEIDLLEQKQHEMSADLLVIRKDVENIGEGVKRVESIVNKTSDKLDHLKDQRVEDHYVAPLTNYRKLSWQIILTVLGIIVAFLIGAMFPMLISK